MKLKEDPEKEIETLDDVSFEQAEKLKRLGFDWNCGKAFDKNGEEVNWTTKHFYCWKPTVALAQKFMRKRFGIYVNLHIRHWDTRLFGFSGAHALLGPEIIGCDLSAGADDVDYDGITSFDYDEAESKTLTYSLDYVLKDFERDLSFLKEGKEVAINFYPNPEMARIKELDNKLKCALFEKHGWIEYRLLFENMEQLPKTLKENEQ